MHSPEADTVQIDNAGLSAVAGRWIDLHSAAVLVDLGGDPAGFRPHEFMPESAQDADLVLTMTRGQHWTVLKTSPRGLRRTFALT